jgi:hypothetical protein
VLGEGFAKTARPSLVSRIYFAWSSFIYFRKSQIDGSASETAQFGQCDEGAFGFGGNGVEALAGWPGLTRK